MTVGICPERPQKSNPARDQDPLQPGRPPKLLNGPLVTKGLTMKIYFGFPSVPLRFRGYVILESYLPTWGLQMASTLRAQRSGYRGRVNEEKTMTFNKVI